MYVEADLAMKKRGLNELADPKLRQPMQVACQRVATRPTPWPCAAELEAAFR